jgi:hypothetical protein
MYKVCTSNLGLVYDGKSEVEARLVFHMYCDPSTRPGRAAGESVTMFCAGQLLQVFARSPIQCQEIKELPCC